MPYIEQKDRETIGPVLIPLLDFIFDEKLLANPGPLNYIITKICHAYIEDQKLCYTTLNEVIGVLECAKLELYRMVGAKYEDKKRLENGPVSELDDDSHERMR